MMPPDERVKVGVGAVVLNAGYLLMVKRGGVGEYASDGHGTWSVPGGWLDFGETPEGAAVREVMEETGVNVTSGRRLGFVSAMSECAPVQIITLFIQCTWVRGHPTVTEPEKCPEAKWVAKGMLDEMPLFAPLRAYRSQYEL